MPCWEFPYQQGFTFIICTFNNHRIGSSSDCDVWNELDADAFAAEYLGNTLAADGLADLKTALIRHIESGSYDEESGQASVRELELRIAVLLEGIAQETE